LRNILVIGILLCLVVLICGCTTGTQDVPAATAYRMVTATVAATNYPVTPTQTVTPVPTPVPTASPIDLTGTGQQASQKFHLTSGLAIFNMKHSGESNFAIWLLDSNGNKVDLMVNEIGSFDGSKAEHITTAGDYVLDITADGPWTVEVQQPIYTSADNVPISLSGTGQSVTKPFHSNGGLITFKMTHDGSSNFAIWLLDAKGNRQELLVNEIGTFDGSKALGVKSGVYLLDITADGNWKVDVS
jgi:hypothetical protein